MWCRSACVGLLSVVAVLCPRASISFECHKTLVFLIGSLMKKTMKWLLPFLKTNTFWQVSCATRLLAFQNRGGALGWRCLRCYHYVLYQVAHFHYVYITRVTLWDTWSWSHVEFVVKMDQKAYLIKQLFYAILFLI